jgi:alpha-mannosidase
VLQPPSRRILWRVDEMPGFAWRRWLAHPTVARDVNLVGSRLSNGLIDVDVDGDTATFSVGTVSGFGRLVDSGDHGDTYNYSPPDQDQLVDRPDRVDVQVLEQGPVRARVALHASYRWPEEVDDRTRARVGTVSVDVLTVVELRAGEPFVRVRHAWDNRCRDHRVRAVLPLPVPAVTSSAECAFAIVERGLHAEGGPTERAQATTFSRRFVRAGGLTVVHDGLLEYELTGGDGRSLEAGATSAEALSITLLRSTGMLSRVEMRYRPLPAGPPLPVRGPQRQGPIAATYAVCVDPDVDPYALADDVLLPLQVAIGLGGGPRDADEGQALRLEGAEVSAVVRDGDRLVLRLFNPHAEPSTARLPGRSGSVVDLRGRPQRAFVDEVELGPWQILTLRLDD